jgi:hypothetical protein
MQRGKKPGELAYGYRIQYAKRGHYASSQLFCWRKKKDGLPPEWEQLKQNEQVSRGRLFKRGRMIDSF